MTGTAISRTGFQSPAQVEALLPLRLKSALTPGVAYRSPITGEERRAGTEWSLPARITATLIADARAAVPALEAALAPGGPESIALWLTQLGTALGGRLSPDEAREKVATYTKLLAHRDIPRFVFTTRSLAEASKQFAPWFPAEGELAAFLEGLVKDHRATLTRCRTLADASPREPEEPATRYKDLPPEKQQALDEKIAAAKRALRADDLDKLLDGA